VSKIYEEDSCYGNDPNYIRFSKDFKKTEGSRVEVVAQVVRNSGVGLSWMDSSSSSQTPPMLHQMKTVVDTGN